MNEVDGQYQDLIDRVDVDGVDKRDRTGVGSRSVFGHQMRFDLSDYKLPLLTTKKVYTRAIVHELLWMLSGDTNIRYLKKHNVHIWDSWITPASAEYRDLTDAEIETALKQHHRVNRIVFDHGVSTEELVELSKDQDVLVLVGLDVSTTPWKDAYRKTFEQEPRVLIAGDCPKVYGKQWRRWDDTRIVPAEELDFRESQGFTVLNEVQFGEYAITREIDQIADIVYLLKNAPDSRRIILTAWNVAEIYEMGLPPCHCFAQFWTRELTLLERVKWADLDHRWHLEYLDINRKEIEIELAEMKVPERALSCQLYIRSNDLPLGFPFNVVQYALLTHMLAHVTGMVAEELIYTAGDCHVYANQWEGLEEQLNREPLEDNEAVLILNPTVTNIDDFTFEDITITGYLSHPPVKFPAAAV